MVFLLILPFCCHSVCDFGIPMSSVRHRPRDFSANFGQKVCHDLSGDKGGGGSRQTVTNGDKGRGGSKIGIFTVTYFLNDPFQFFCKVKQSRGTL